MSCTTDIGKVTEVSSGVVFSCLTCKVRRTTGLSLCRDPVSSILIIVAVVSTPERCVRDDVYAFQANGPKLMPITNAVIPIIKNIIVLRFLIVGSTCVVCIVSY